MDAGKVLVIVHSPEVVNKIVKVKINNTVHDIRILEEPFSSTHPQRFSDKIYQSLEDCSLEELDCVYTTLDSLERVPETLLSSPLLCELVDTGTRPLDKETSRNLVFSNFERVDLIEKAILGKARKVLSLQEIRVNIGEVYPHRQVCSEPMTYGGGSLDGNEKNDNLEVVDRGEIQGLDIVGGKDVFK